MAPINPEITGMMKSKMSKPISKRVKYDSKKMVEYVAERDVNEGG